MKPLHFIITGLISGSLCWLSSTYLFLELQVYETLVTYLPGIILAIALLVLGKKLGMIPGSNTTTSAGILVGASLIAQFFIVEYQLSEFIWWEMGFYPPLIAGGETAAFDLLPLFVLPTPVILAIHASVMAIGIAFAWDFPAPLRRVLIRASIYGALFGLLILFFTHLVSPTAIDSINDALNIADQTRYIETLNLLSSLYILISLLLWHSLLLLALYMSVRTPSSSAVISDQIQSDPEKHRNSQHVASSTNTIKPKEITGNQLMPHEIVALLKTRNRATQKFFWALLVSGLIAVTGTTYYYKTLTDDAYQSMLDAHKPVVQKHAANHPLYKLWPALKACGGELRVMKDILWATDTSSEIMACEALILNRLKHDQKDWLFTLRSETTNLLYSIDGELLLQYNSPNHPNYAFWSALRECGNMDDIIALIESKEKGEVLTEDQLYLTDCMNEKKARIQKSIDGYTTTLANSDDAALESQGVHMGDYYDSDYKYFTPPEKISEKSWAYWDNYYATMPGDYSSDYPPRSSFQEALNRSWQFGEIILPITPPDDPSTYFHDGTLELLTPIIIDGETQAIILSTLSTFEMDEYIVYEWQNYRNLTIPMILILIIIFLWYEHRTLARISKTMDPNQWKAGMWRPSLLTLYLVDGYRYFHLFNMLIFFLFSVLFLLIPAEELWRDEMTWDTWLIHIVAAMSLPLLFSLFVIPRMLTDFRLFKKGIAVKCKKVGEKTEELTSGSIRHINTEYHHRFYYEAEYQGKLYEFAAPAGNADDNSAIALINPDRLNHGLILNNFYEKG